MVLDMWRRKYHLKPCALSVSIRWGVDAAVVKKGGDGRILEAGLGWVTR
jgi:hypothetical protein